MQLLLESQRFCCWHCHLPSVGGGHSKSLCVPPSMLHIPMFPGRFQNSGSGSFPWKSTPFTFFPTRSWQPSACQAPMETSLTSWTTSILPLEDDDVSLYVSDVLCHVRSGIQLHVPLPMLPSFQCWHGPRSPLATWASGFHDALMHLCLVRLQFHIPCIVVRFE